MMDVDHERPAKEKKEQPIGPDTKWVRNGQGNALVSGRIKMALERALGVAPGQLEPRHIAELAAGQKPAGKQRPRR